MPRIQAVTDTIKPHNEDAHGYAEKMAWVMDGALPLSKTHVTDGPSDVVWVVNWWERYLNAMLSSSPSDIHGLMERGVNQLNTAFSKFVDVASLSKLDRASASIGVTRVKDATFECFVLGDVEIALQLKDETYAVLTDERIAALDQEVIQMIASHPNRDVVFNGYTEAELEKLRANRMRMNSETGYAILEHETSAIRKGVYRTYAVDTIKSVLIMSDGFSALYNKYGCYTLEGLFGAIKNQGVAPLIQTLRSHEKKDFKTCQRLRKHDDATVVYLSFE